MAEMYEKSRGMNETPLWMSILDDIYSKVYKKMKDKYLNVEKEFYYKTR